MSKLPIEEHNKNHVIIDTNVKIGKSYKSKGWALSRHDIHNWLPVEKFEKMCKIIINNIESDAKLRFNPRLFYKSKELSNYLETLYQKGYSNEKIPMKIIIDEKNLYSETFSTMKITEINTKLLVGKSYASKGWRLTNETMFKIFNLESYDNNYKISINNIISDAKIDLQFRLFYNNIILSEYLEKLYNKDSKQKIDVKIIFDSNSQQNMEYSCDNMDNTQKENENETSQNNYNLRDDIDNKLKEDKPTTSKNNDSQNETSCKICGKNNITYDNTANDFKDLCDECMEKLKVLQLYNTIKDSSFSSFIKKEFIKEKLEPNVDKNWNLLLKYEFITSMGDLYKLSGNNDVENQYSQYLPNAETKINSTKTKHKEKIRNLIESYENKNIEKVENTCIICGDTLNNEEREKCSSCFDKNQAVEDLKKIVENVPYGKKFNKDYLKECNLNDLNINILLNKLVKYNLLKFENNTYKLNDVSYLNEFIEKYSSTKYKLQINYKTSNSNIIKISENDLSSEERIDSMIKWITLGDYITFKKGQYGFITVHFKNKGTFLYSKGFSTSYEAKIEAIKYLKSLGKLTYMDDEKIKLKITSRRHNHVK